MAMWIAYLPIRMWITYPDADVWALAGQEMNRVSDER